MTDVLSDKARQVLMGMIDVLEWGGWQQLGAGPAWETDSPHCLAGARWVVENEFGDDYYGASMEAHNVILGRLGIDIQTDSGADYARESMWNDEPGRTEIEVLGLLYDLADCTHVWGL